MRKTDQNPPPPGETDTLSEFKDLFSKQSGDYARFRPHYPIELFQHLASLTTEHQLAWDVGTGNGQSAHQLASYFSQIIATDPSEAQISHALPHPQVQYLLGRAEQSPLASQSADLVAVAQAFHWFQADAFFGEVARVLKPGGILALWCYELAQITPEIDAVVMELYRGQLGPYWDPARKLVEEGYRHVSLPFAEIPCPTFTITAEWSLDQWVGYLSTWSALHTFIKQKGFNPLGEIYPALKAAWGSAPTRTIRWPLGLRVAQKNRTY